MSEELTDEQSHYEISLTAGQAFVAFVLLLLSLAASFAFGLMIGKGQADERLVVKREPSVVTEASVVPKKSQGRIVELGVGDEDFAKPATDTSATDTTGTPVVTEATTTAPAAATLTAAEAHPAEAPAETKPAPPAQPKAVEAKPVAHAGTPVYAQLLSTGDQKTAEALAARLINGGFNGAYVERGSAASGTIFRVRVRFDSDAEAHAAEAKLRDYSKDVWITH